jgi:Xaa-Pro aminopeptidase
MMDGDFHRSRRQGFYEDLDDGEALVLFAGSPPRKTADANYSFFANRNFYYLTGILQARSVFLAVKCDDEISESLFVLKKDPMAERWQGRRLSREEVSEKSGVEQVKDLEAFDRDFRAVLGRGELSAIWYDFDKHDVGRRDAPQNRHCDSTRSDYPAVTFKNAHPSICSARTIKTPEEIQNIREAMCITRDGIHAMMKAAKPGMYEYQLEAIFKKVLADAGLRDPAFASIISGGRNNFYIHYEDPMDVLKDGDLILSDVGARKNEYVNDISRAFPVNGEFSAEQKDVYAIALKVNKELMEMLVPGKVTFADIETHARRRVGEELVAAGFLDRDEDVGKFYWHGGTHHLGLDVHDVGMRPMAIEPGMVFTIDVGIYMEDRNIGFRVEDDVAITQAGHEHLSSEIVREIDDIEAIMS